MRILPRTPKTTNRRDQNALAVPPARNGESGPSRRVVVAWFRLAVPLTACLVGTLGAMSPEAAAQVVRLPAVAPENPEAFPATRASLEPRSPPDVQWPNVGRRVAPGEAAGAAESPSRPSLLARLPDAPSTALDAPGEADAPAPSGAWAWFSDEASNGRRPPALPMEVRPGMFQKLIVDATWLAPGSAAGMGQTDLELQMVLGLPCPTRDSPLILTPGWATHFLDGPAGLDLPSELHDAYVQFRWMRKLQPRLGIDLAFTPTISSDFRQQTDDAMRYCGHGALAWDLTGRLTLVAGVARFDRLDVDVLPIGGLIWTPTEDWKLDLLFPQPKIARRVEWFGPSTERLEHWFYFAAEFGGGKWAIQRAGGPDVVDLRDYRLLLGLQRKAIGRLDGRLEIGYVFGRNIQFRSASPEYSPDDTLLLRGGLVY